MQVIINSDKNIDTDSKTVQHWEGEVASALDRFDSWITRIEVHLTDENSKAKDGPDDIRCLMEARPSGQKPISIEVRSASVHQAVSEAIGTMERRLGNIADKARTERRRSGGHQNENWEEE